MASNTRLSIASWNLSLNAALDVLNGGFVEIYNGTQPATPDTAVTSQTLLATLALSATAFAAATGGSKTANSITSTTGVANGTATWFRAYKSDDVTAVVDGTVGPSASDMIMTNPVIVSGGSVAVASWVFAMPVGQ